MTDVPISWVRSLAALVADGEEVADLGLGLASAVDAAWTLEIRADFRFAESLHFSDTTAFGWMAVLRRWSTNGKVAP